MNALTHKSNPVSRDVLRWLAFLPTVFVVAAAGMVVTILLLDAFEYFWLALPTMAFGLGAAVYLGSRVVPSGRRWAIALASALLVLTLGYLLSLTAPGDREARGLAASGAGGIAVGALLALRGQRSAALQSYRPVAGKSLRYKGTAPFQGLAVDRKTFFGRDRETRSLLSLVLAEHLVVVFGKSGMGKSSLINAGLVDPLLERDYLPMTIRLTDQGRGPVGGLIDSVRAAARTAAVEIVGGDDNDLYTFFRTAEFWSPNNDLLQPVLILDQFEELFTLHAPERRRDFIAQLAELVRGPAASGRVSASTPGAPVLDSGVPKLKIVLSLREDHLADLEELARDIPGVLQNRFRVGPLTAANAREAIIKPAALDDPEFDTPPFTYSEEALQRILGFLARRRQGSETVSGDDVEPVQLQLVCQYIESLAHTRSMRRGTPVHVSEADLGGEIRLQRVLEEFYDRTLASIESPGERRRIRRLCEQRLISSAGRRLTEAEEEIEHRHGVSAETLRHLVDTRLLRPEPRLGGMFYELSHDTLVEPIRRSRQKRIGQQRRVWIGTVALLVAYFVPWWVFTGRDNRTRQQALAFAVTSLPARDDPGQLLALPRARLAAIEEQSQLGVAARDEYAAMMFAADDVGLLYPELTSDVQRLQRDMTDRFNQANGLRPVAPTEDDSLNRRVLIAGGTFAMGSPEGSGEPAEHPQHRVTVSAFRMQEHEVTNAEYRRFDPNHDRLAPGDLPVVNVSWYDAAASAAWLGGSLPTEAQWEFAARGSTGRLYPWGEDGPTCAHANFMNCGAMLLPAGTGRDDGRTPEQVYDLAGNAWEWCRDRYDAYLDGDRADPLGASTGSARVVRGGSFFNVPYDLRGTNRYSSTPAVRNDSLGFRVVWREVAGRN